jgi:hypothetical protein
VLVALAAAAPSGAVVGGEPVAAELVPWFADVGGCGGMLMAPARVHARGEQRRGVSPAPFARTSMVKIPR